MAGCDEIAAAPLETCPVCGARGAFLYDRLSDLLFDAPGSWRLVRCPNSTCGLLWLDPMPQEPDLHKAYRTYPTHQDAPARQGRLGNRLSAGLAAYRQARYGIPASAASRTDKLMAWVFRSIPSARVLADYPFSLLADRPKGCLLEIGCGGGETLKLLDQWGWTVSGLDTDANAVANARSKGLAVREGDLFAAGFAADGFDAVYSSHVVEHVPSPSRLFIEIERILKPGGICVVATPNARSLGHRFFGRNWRGLEPPRHLHLMTPEALTILAERAGLAVREVITSPRLAAAIYIQSMLLRRQTRLPPRAPLVLKLAAVFAQVAAHAYWLFARRSGEEIILIGEKQR